MMDTLKLDEALNDGLLVPFRNRDDHFVIERKEENSSGDRNKPLFAEVPPANRTSLLGKLWNRSNRNKNPSQDTNSLLASLDTECTSDSHVSCGSTFKHDQSDSMCSDRNSTSASYPPVEEAKLNGDNHGGSSVRVDNSKTGATDEGDEEESDEVGDKESDDEEIRASSEPQGKRSVIAQRKACDDRACNMPQNLQIVKERPGSGWDDQFQTEVSTGKRSLIGKLWSGSLRNKITSQDTSSLLDSFHMELHDPGGNAFKDEQKDAVRRQSDRKTTTFAFPTAHVEQADLVDEARKDENFEDTEGEDSEKGPEQRCEETESDEEENKIQPEPKVQLNSLFQTRTWDYEVKESQPRQWTKEGYGSDPVQEEKKGVFGKVLQHFGRSKKEKMTASEVLEMERRMKREEQRSLRSMRVATADTKNNKTLADLANAALVVLVPVLADEDDGDENLGTYCTISTTADEDVYAVNPEFKLKQDIYLLQKKVNDLEKRLKSAELEANSWRLRSKELEAEVRNLKGGDSSDESGNEDEGYADGVDCFIEVKENESMDAHTRLHVQRRRST